MQGPIFQQNTGDIFAAKLFFSTTAVKKNPKHLVIVQAMAEKIESRTNSYTVI